MNDRKDSYNKFTDYPELSYNCISYLVNNEEVLWKLLKYADMNAWKADTSHPNLTKSQKGALIYSGQPDETNYRVFMDVGQDIAWTSECCFIRISPVELSPTNYVYGNVTMAFEVYSHYKINHLSNYKTRIEMVTQRLIELFNGEEIDGLGRLYFDHMANPRCRTVAIGQIPYKGKVTMMCNWSV